MLIDWFTVAAQIVNFGILVFLLHRFLYRPIVRHMTEREEKIKQRLEEAADKKSKAQEQIEEFQRKCDELDKKADQQLKQAQAEAEKRKEELLNEAQKHVNDQREKWLQALDREKNAFAGEFKKRGSEEILKYIRRIIKDLADEPLNNRLARVLAAKIGNLDQQDRKKLQRAGRAEKISIRSTFELDSQEKRKLTTILHEICGKEAEVVYQVDSEYPLGIEAQAGNVRLSWDIDSYLEELKSRLLSLVEEKTHDQKKSNDNGSEKQSRAKDSDKQGKKKKEPEEES
ncbi:MAG: F0F1 ATP synthase subunit delta [Pelovirga sp.]